MNAKIKDILGLALIVLALAVAGSAVYFVRSYENSSLPGSVFAVSADAKVVVKPDVAQVTASVITQGGKNLGDLQNQNSDSANKMIDFLKSEGVSENDIKTSSYQIEPRYQYCSSLSAGAVCPPPAIVGYTVSQDLTVKIRDFSKTSSILSGLVKNGANSVSQLSFSLDDPTASEDEARTQAITKAEAKALKMAQEAGFRLGSLVSIDAENSTPNPIMPYAAALQSAGPNIEPGSQTVSVTVTLKYGIIR